MSWGAAPGSFDPGLPFTCCWSARMHIRQTILMIAVSLLTLGGAEIVSYLKGVFQLFLRQQ